MSSYLARLHLTVLYTTVSSVLLNVRRIFADSPVSIYPEMHPDPNSFRIRKQRSIFAEKSVHNYSFIQNLNN